MHFTIFNILRSLNNLRKKFKSVKHLTVLPVFSGRCGGINTKNFSPTYIRNLIYGLTDAVSEITGIQLITFLQEARITVLHKTVRYYKYFKSEQRSALLVRKERSLRQIETGAGSVSSSGVQWEIITPTEIPKWNLPPIEAGTSVRRLCKIKN